MLPALLADLTDSIYRNMQQILKKGADLEKLKTDSSTWK